MYIYIFRNNWYFIIYINYLENVYKNISIIYSSHSITRNSGDQAKNLIYRGFRIIESSN